MCNCCIANLVFLISLCLYFFCFVLNLKQFVSQMTKSFTLGNKLKESLFKKFCELLQHFDHEVVYSPITPENIIAKRVCVEGDGHISSSICGSCYLAVSPLCLSP